MFRTLLVALSFTAIAAAASAGQPPVEDADSPRAIYQPRPAPTPVPPTPPPPGILVAQDPPAPAPPRKSRGRDVNVQIELTISDQAGTSAPEKKVVSLLAADQTMGRVRANAHARQKDIGMVGTVLNVDAYPTVLEGDRILLQVTLEYAPLREQLQQPPTTLNESINVILQNGKPLVISQAADPVSDRRMTVEVKATILK
jgi:hypothetical protein